MHQHAVSGSPNIRNWEIILIVVVNFNVHGHEIEYVEEQFPPFYWNVSHKINSVKYKILNS